MQGVRAILFDVFGTVVDWRGSLIDQFAAFGAARGLEADWAGLADAWRGAYAPSMNEVRRGEVAWANLDALQRRSIERIAAGRGLAGLSSADLDELTRFWHRLRPWPDAAAGLARLRARYVISPLSNGSVAGMVGVARSAGLPWDLVLCAEVFRHYKPDPETYLGACALLALPPGAVMLCAAHNSDLRAAAALGLRTGFVPRPTEHGPNQASDLAPDGAWDVVAADFNDLATQLGA